MAANKPGPTGNDNSQTLTFQSQRNFSDRVDSEPGGQVAVLVHGSVWLWLSQLGRNVRLGNRRVRVGGGEDGEEQRGDRNADEHENESLFAEHVANRASHAEPRLRRLRRVGVAHGLRLVATEYQLRSHFQICFRSRSNNP